MEMIKANEVKIESLILSNQNKGELRNGVPFEYITIQGGLTEDKEVHVVEIGSSDWYNLKCIEVPQKIAIRQLTKGTNRHFERTDLESYLTEEAFKILNKYERNKNPYFEAHLRKCLGRKVATFFTDTEVEKITDLETTFMSKNTDEEDTTVEVFDEPVDIWAELHSQWEVEDIIADLEPEEQFIATKLLDGYNSSEIAKELGVYRLKVRRAIQKIVDKAKLEKRKERTTKRTYLEATVSKPKNLKHYNKLVEVGKLNNKILGLTAKIWTKENKLAEELAKLEGLEEDKRQVKELMLNTWAEDIELALKDLQELENKLNKLVG